MVKQMMGKIIRKINGNGTYKVIGGLVFDIVPLLVFLIVCVALNKDWTYIRKNGIESGIIIWLCVTYCIDIIFSLAKKWEEDNDNAFLKLGIIFLVVLLGTLSMYVVQIINYVSSYIIFKELNSYICVISFVTYIVYVLLYYYVKSI